MLKRRIETAPAVVPKTVPFHASSRTITNDFLHHPREFPLRFRRVMEWFKPGRKSPSPHGDLGLSFHADHRLAPGSRLELTIPLRSGCEKFPVTVVLVRELPDGFEIGVWLHSIEDAARARLVEQICGLETSLLRRRAARPADVAPGLPMTH